MIAKSRLLIACGALATGALIAGCAGSKPAPQVVEEVKAPVVDEAAVARKAAEEAAAKEREAAARKAKEEAAARMAREEAARQARQFNPLYFDFDSYAIRDGEQEMLADYTKRLADNGDLTVALEGHCDERGTTAYNLALGQKRADSVRTYLTRAGIAAERLTTVSYGEERPADPRHDEAGWALNRRVELVAAN